MALDSEGSKLKRAANRESSPDVLQRHGVEFKAHNNGIHLIVRCAKGDVVTIVDFWPGTGKFIARGAPRPSGRGVFNLIKRFCDPGKEDN